MLFKRISSIILVILMACLFKYPGQIDAAQMHRITLMEAMHIAIDQNPLVEKAKEALAKAKLDISVANSVVKPSIGMEVGRNYNHNYAAYGLMGTLLNKDPDAYSASEIKNNDLNLYLSQPIYAQGKYGLKKKVVTNGIMIAQYNLELVKQDVLFEVIEAYLAILKAREIITIREQARDRLSEYLQSTKIKYEVGLVAQNIVIGAEMELCTAESDLIEAEVTYKIREENLKRILQLSMEDTIDVIKLNIGENIGAIAEIKKTKEQLIDCALKNRLDYLMFLKQMELAENNITLAYSDFLPTINLNAAYIKEGEEFLPKEELYSIGATISIPFFEKGLRIYKVRETKNEARQLASQKKDLEQMIRFEVVNALFSLNSLLSRLKATEKHVEFATENMRITKLQFNEGAASNLDVLDANLKLVEAATGRTTREYDIILAKYTLKKTIGDLRL